MILEVDPVLLFVVVVATEAVTEIVVESELMDPVRMRLGRSWFLGSIVTCGYCLSVWVAFALWSLCYAHWIFVSFCLGMVVHRASNVLHSLLKFMMGWSEASLVLLEEMTRNEMEEGG